MKIVTDYWMKPIPVRDFDWSATVDNYEAGDPIGYGETESKAKADLMSMIVTPIETMEER